MCNFKTDRSKNKFHVIVRDYLIIGNFTIWIQVVIDNEFDFYKT